MQAGSTGAPPTFRTFSLRLAKPSHRADNQNSIAWQSDNNFQQLDIRDQAGSETQAHAISFDSMANEQNQATEWQTLTATFRPSSSCLGCTLFLHVQQSTWTPGHLGGNDFFLGGMQLSRAAVQLPAVSMFEGGKFRVANWHRPPTPSDLGASQTACPGAQGGLQLWHQASTWGQGDVPAAGAARVDVPANSKVLVCRCSLPSAVTQARLPFGHIHVPSTSELIFDDAPIALHVGGITVQGSLRAGAPTCRHNWPMNVTFHGEKQAVLASGASASTGNTKGLVVSGSGTLDLHGRRFFPTWTRLRAAVWPTESRLELQDAVNWEVGQRILLVTSIWRDEEDNQNEVRRITAVSQDRRTLLLDAPVTHMHWAGEEYQTEVALLDRVLTLEGAEADSSVATGGFGGHVMWTGSAVGRVSGTRFYRMGQTNQLARYAVHMHLLGNGGASSYVSDSSVESSFYRCIVVHGTNQATVNENVCFDVIGHAIYMSEDGNEEDNDITYNLAAYVHVIGQAAAGGGQGGQTFLQSDQLTNPADAAAAGYYITNAWNTIKGNAASGGWTGFSHPNLQEFIGVFQNQAPADNMRPENRPTKVWIGNTAHSSGYQWSRGSCIYVGGRLWHDEDEGGLLKYISGRENRDTKLPDGSETWMRFEDTRVWLCQRGLNHWGNQIELHNYEVTDSTRAAVLFGEALVKGAVITGRSNNPAATMSRTGFQAYDTWVKTMLVDVTFRNFDSSRGDYCVFAMTHSPEFKPQFINAARDIKWENVDRAAYYFHEPRPPYSTGSARMYSWWSPDGTLVDRHGPWIVGSHTDWWHLDDATCEWDLDWSIWMCKAKPERSIAHVTLVIPGYMQNNAEPPFNVLGYSSLLRANHSIPFTQNPGLTGIAGPSGWYLRLHKGAPTQLDTELITVKRGHYVPLAVKYPAGTTFTVQLLTKWYVWPQNQRFDVPQANSLADIFQPAGVGLKSQDELPATCTGSGKPGVAGTLCDKASMGADGPLWIFDGSFLWLRVVQPTYYLDRSYKRQPWWTREGMTIQDLEGGFKYEIRATCPAGTLRHGGDFCEVADSIPLAGQPMPGDVDTSDDDAIWVKPSASGTPAPVAASASGTPASVAASASGTPRTAQPSSDPTRDPQPSPSDKPAASPSDKPAASPSDKPAASPSDKPAASPSDKPAASPSDKPAASPSDKPAASPSDKPAASPSDKPAASPSDKPAASASPSPVDICADRPDLCSNGGQCVTRPAGSLGQQPGAGTQQGGVWTAPTQTTVYCVCKPEWTGLFCDRPVEADVPSDREVPLAAAVAKLCADGKRSMQAVMTTDGITMHVESDVDCGSAAVAAAAAAGVSLSTCDLACDVGMGCFGDADCASSSNGATVCRVLPASGDELAQGSLSFERVASAGRADMWGAAAPGTCVRAGVLSEGMRGLVLRLWLWGITKEDFASAGMSRVVAQALGRAVADAWLAAKGSAASLGNGVSWGDLISVLRVSAASRSSGSAGGRALQASSGSSGVEVHVLVQGVSGLSEADLTLATRNAVQDGGALSGIINSVPGLPVTGLSSDVDEAEVGAVSSAAAGPPPAPIEGGDGGDAGMGSSTIIVIAAVVAAVAVIAAVALFVHRRQQGASATRATAVGEKCATPQRKASFSAIPGQHMVNPLSMGPPSASAGGKSARSARILQLQAQLGAKS